jgi:hypothetical protein
MLKEDKTQKRVERHDETQEDFTPIGIVNGMMDQFPKEAFTNMSKTIIDYSAGNGNFLVEALDRKLDHSKNIDDAIEALKAIYGVELMADNVEECRERLYALTISRYPKIKTTPELDYKVRNIIKNRIQWHDSLAFNYNKWPAIGKQRTGFVSFKEVPGPCDDMFPMWHKGEPCTQLTLFDESFFE